MNWDTAKLGPPILRQSRSETILSSQADESKFLSEFLINHLEIAFNPGMNMKQIYIMHFLEVVFFVVSIHLK